jgi:hypothetical protein
MKHLSAGKLIVLINIESRELVIRINNFIYELMEKYNESAYAIILRKHFLNGCFRESV